MERLERRIREMRDRLNVQRGQLEGVERRLQRATRDFEETEKRQRIEKESVVLLEHAGRAARELVTRRFNEVVTFALQSVFGEDYSFSTALEIKRNSVWAEFRVNSSRYSAPADPLESRGGGVVDIVSLALRVILLELFTPQIAGPIVFDEPTRHLSTQYSTRAAELMNAIADRTGRQIVLVTHDKLLASNADVMVEL